MRKVTLIGLAALVVGIVGVGGGVAALAWSGEPVLAEQLPGEPYRARRESERRPPPRRLWEFTVELDPSMNPLAATFNVAATGAYDFRVTGPDGIEIFADRGSGSGAGPQGGMSARFLQPIEVKQAGSHRITCDVHRYSDASFELRRNAILPPLPWFFTAGLVCFGSVICLMYSMASGSLRSYRMAVLAAKAAAADAPPG